MAWLRGFERLTHPKAKPTECHRHSVGLRKNVDLWKKKTEKSIR